jgi:hypothetical protein
MLRWFESTSSHQKAVAKILPQLFYLLYRTKSAKAMTDFQSAFYRDVQLLPGGWIFLLPTFSAAFRMLRQYRIILSAAAAGAVLEPLGGNCAVLP